MGTVREQIGKLMSTYHKTANDDAIKQIMLHYKLPITNQTANYNDLDKALSQAVEFTKSRKNKGAYYTPSDVAGFMVDRVFDKLEKPLSATFFDPTCGSGAFLLIVLKKKIDAGMRPLDALATIYGNDIDPNALLVAKLRILIYLLNYNIDLGDAFSILDDNFIHSDFIRSSFNAEFDVVLGNPPFIETKALPTKPIADYGNVYANVLINANRCLATGGKIAFVVPLSFISTLRMKKLRQKEFDAFAQMTIYSFADRPGSLFSQVHQKVAILIGEGYNSKLPCQVYTTHYNFNYSETRDQLFAGLLTELNDDVNDDFVPKYGTFKEKEIYQKLTNPKNTPLTKILTHEENDQPLYLVKRASFFIKCFLQQPDSKEYTKYYVHGISNKAMLAILSSSLFWFYWTMVSDGWHVTTTVLKHFTIPEIDKEMGDRLSFLADRLLVKLEQTKVYVGIKQTDYEYKHKVCFDVLGKIDDTVCQIYGLDTSSSDYVKNFGRIYRAGK